MRIPPPGTLFYAGIGSTETPEEICSLMSDIASQLCNMGYWLRSGGAPGADSAFELPVAFNKEIYLPWPRFNGNRSPLFEGENYWAAGVAAKYHPVWERLGEGARKLHTRNVCPVLGARPHSAKSRFVVCWTEGGRVAGGTAQALRIAADQKIPIFNLYNEAALPMLQDVLQSWHGDSFVPLERV